MKFYHVIENGQRNGEQVYVQIRTFRYEQAMTKWVSRRGKPVWVVESDRAELVVWGAFGHSAATYWNSGAGWQVGPMYGLKLVDERRGA